MVLVVYIQRQNATVGLAEAVWPPRAAFSLAYLYNLLFSPKQQNQFQEKEGSLWLTFKGAVQSGRGAMVAEL